MATLANDPGISKSDGAIAAQQASIRRPPSAFNVPDPNYTRPAAPAGGATNTVSYFPSFGGATMTDMAMARNPVGTSRIINGEPMTAADILPAAAAPAPQSAAPASAPAPAPTPDASSSGGQLVAGLHRFNGGANGPHGIYAAQMKDGSMGFTDDPNGLSGMGGGIVAGGPTAAGTQVHNFSNAGAYSSGPQPSDRVYGPNDQVPESFMQKQSGMPAQLGVNADASAGLRRMMTGGGTPNADRAYAPNSLQRAGVNTDPTAINSSNVYQLGALQKQLQDAGNNADPETRLANAAISDRINAHLQSVSGGQYGAGGAGAAPTMLGAMGSGGLKTMLEMRAQQEKAAHDKAGEDHASSALDRQNADDASKAYTTAQSDPLNTTHAEDNVVIKHAPQSGMSRAQFEAWRGTNEGRTNQADLMTSLRRSAQGTTHVWNQGDRAASSLKALTPAHFRFDGPGGSFSGMNNDPGDNAYPTTKRLGFDQYNQGLLDAYGKNYLQWMKDDAKNGR